MPLPSLHDPDIQAKARQHAETMPIEDCVTLCHGHTNFSVIPPRDLNLPPLVMSDGPHGVREELDPTAWRPLAGFDSSVTALPPAITLAATWDRDLARRFGETLGAEARARGKDVILGPGVNIIRTPLCGRNFEYFSEDPVLTAKLAVPLVRGIQAKGTAACVKHFALNNQESDRFNVDVAVDERTLREIYLPAFEAVVREGEVYTVMAAYNRFEGRYCCQHIRLLHHILKQEWGFPGLVMSDWGGVHDTREAAESGLDLEMAGGPDFKNLFLARPYLDAIKQGALEEMSARMKAERVLRVCLALHHSDRGPGTRNTEAHRRTAYDIAAAGIVLLKNEQVLPWRSETLKNVLVVGDNATRQHCRGGGSSAVPAAYEITPLEGLRNRLGDAVHVDHVPGYPLAVERGRPIPSEFLSTADERAGLRGWKAEIFDNARFKGSPVRIEGREAVDEDQDGLVPNSFSIRWTTELTAPETGTYRFSLEGVDCVQFYLDDRLLINTFGNAEPELRVVKCPLKEGQTYRLRLHLNPHAESARAYFGWTRPSDPTIDTAKALNNLRQKAREADAVLFVGGLTHRLDTEGADRVDLALPDGQDEVIDTLLMEAPNTIIALYGGGAMTMPWIDQARAVLFCGYGGMETGHALADVLSGVVNPSGRLPVTFPRRLEDHPAHAVGDYQDGHCEYREGLFTGYRGYRSDGTPPLFPFGHGLSYTTFAYTDAEVIADEDEIRVKFTLTNTGECTGTETAQIYVTRPDDQFPQPERELKGFQRITLHPGESRTVELPIPHRDLTTWTDTGPRLLPGTYLVHISGTALKFKF